MSKKIKFEDIELLCQNTSFEAVGVLNGGSQAVQKLTSLTKTTLGYMAQKMASLNSILVYFKGFKRGQYVYYRTFTQKYKYLEVSQNKIQVPDGFTGNLSEYADTLLKTFEECTSKIITDIIDPFNTHVSKLINQPALLSSQSYKHAIGKSDVERYRKDISKFHSAKKHNQLSIGEVYARMADIDTHADTMDKINELQQRYPLSDVQVAVNKLDGNLNALIEVITDKSNNITLSQKVINDLSELTLELAKQVEFFAVVDHLIAALTHCSLENVNAFKRMKAQVSKEEYATYIPIYTSEEAYRYLTKE